MFLIEGVPVWSASDLTAAAECEYALLRQLDYRLGRAAPIADDDGDDLRNRIGVLGQEHERRVLERLRQDGDVRVVDLSVASPRTPEQREQAAAAAEAALTDPVHARPGTVLYQPAFFHRDFFGIADFVAWTDAGWLVADAKLARSAKVSALLQLGAYADELGRIARAAGVLAAPDVALILGTGERAHFRVREIQPAFAERRARLRHLLASHLASGAAVRWNDPDQDVRACNRCAECTAAAQEADDVIGVAGLATPQRKKLTEAGVATLADLAAAGPGARPAGMAGATFDKLRAQARLQHAQRTDPANQSDEAGVVPDPPHVHYELTETAAETLALLPAPSPGDLFFDFEGDPLFDGHASADQFGLEYLWGVTDANEQYQATWAHSTAEEKRALEQFVDDVTARRKQYPDLHVYHYAAYEPSALKRLAMRYQTREEELDELLRAEVFVDLYATVRGSLRTGQPSYSIKKLEPLYMGGELRTGDVSDGGTSVVVYHEARELREAGKTVEAEALLADIAEYNAYDCLSTLRLRDWLLERASDVGVADQIVPRPGGSRAPQETADDDAALAEALMERAGPEDPAKRTPEQQAYAMLAAALGYHRREQKQFWWEHYWRLDNAVEDWRETKDVFQVESAELVRDWEVPPRPRARNAERTLRLTGQWGAGSRPGGRAQVIYPRPFPPGASGPERAVLWAAAAKDVRLPESDPGVVELVESRSRENVFSDLPVALTPAPPPDVDNLEGAVREVAQSVAAAVQSPALGVVDLLLRRPPRLGHGGALPQSGDAQADIAAALTAMADSYVAVQGPPGAGKTYTGSRVIRELVERFGWRIGVVAQSHATVENMLRAITGAGLDPALVGKEGGNDREPTQPVTWSEPKNLALFLAEHASSGCVVGGTQWTFANANKVGRGELDLLVIDEAGQFSLASTIAVSVAARRLLLLGDPQQLPQVSQGVHAEPVDVSALGWLAGGADTLPAPLGYFLGQTYRMHPALTSVVSEYAYDGRLAAADAASGRSLAGEAPGLHVVFVEHAGNRVESTEEAREVVAQVQRLLGREWVDPGDPSTPRGLTEQDFLVVAPYNAQVSLIARTLAAAGLGGVRVGTVDRFQGQEAPVVIVSLGASSPADVPRGMGFLLNRNRINVAISRAQWCAILIRSRALTGYLPSTTQGLLELGAFIGLCSASKRPAQPKELPGVPAV